MKTCLLIIFAILPLSINRGLAQPVYEIIYNDIISAGEDFIYVGKGLASLSGSDLATGGGLISATAISMTLDDELHSFSVNGINRKSWDWLKHPNYYGDKTLAAILSSSVYLGGLAIGDDYTRVTGRLMFESLLLSGAFTAIIKVAAGRARPEAGLGNSFYSGFTFTDKYQSLPSGHTTIAFAMSTVLAHRIDKWWSYAGFYSLASMTAAARIYYHRHWISDVILAAGIGTLGGLAILNAENDRGKDEAGVLSFHPALNGINIIYKF